MPSSNRGSSLCLPEFTCNDFSFEAKASNSARTASRGLCSSSHCMANSIGTVISFAFSTSSSDQCRPKAAAVILGSIATSGTPIAVPILTPK